MEDLKKLKKNELVDLVLCKDEKIKSLEDMLKDQDNFYRKRLQEKDEEIERLVKELEKKPKEKVVYDKDDEKSVEFLKDRVKNCPDKKLKKIFQEQLDRINKKYGL